MNQSEENRALLNEVYALVDQWVDESAGGRQPVIDFHLPEELKQKLNLSLGHPGGADAVRESIADYLRYAVRTAHPAYLNQLFGGYNLPAYLGEVVTAATNTSMYTYEVAPVATLMELEVIDKMRSYTGWNSGTGAMMTGGSNTNMVAMLLARNAIFQDAKMEGITGLPKLAVLVSERSHFSMLKAANTIGIGQHGVVKVSLDAQGRMRREGLEQALKETIAKGYMPFMVCSTAGTTETGSFDHIAEVSEFAQSHQMWHHVDGSWGASIVLSEKRRHLFEGLEHADSFSWNPHKLMSIPLVCSVLLVKDPDIMREQIQSHDAGYIYHEDDTSDYNLGPSSLQCGRRVDVLKLWLSWKYHGDEGYSNRIEHLFALAELATSIVEEDALLESMFPLQTLNVNFRVKVPEGVDIDRFNQDLRYRLIRLGKTMVNYCRLDSGLSLRLILLNPDLQEKDVLHFFEVVRTEAMAMLAELLIKKA